MVSSGWMMVGSSQVYMEQMKSALSMLWVSCSGGVSMLNGSSTSTIVVSGKDEDHRIGAGVRVDDWPRGD